MWWPDVALFEFVAQLVQVAGGKDKTETKVVATLTLAGVFIIPFSLFYVFIYDKWQRQVWLHPAKGDYQEPPVYMGRECWTRGLKDGLLYWCWRTYQERCTHVGWLFRRPKSKPETLWLSDPRWYSIGPFLPWYFRIMSLVMLKFYYDWGPTLEGSPYQTYLLFYMGFMGRLFFILSIIIAVWVFPTRGWLGMRSYFPLNANAKGPELADFNPADPYTMPFGHPNLTEPNKADEDPPIVCYIRKPGQFFRRWGKGTPLVVNPHRPKLSTGTMRFDFGVGVDRAYIGGYGVMVPGKFTLPDEAEDLKQLDDDTFTHLTEAQAKVIEAVESNPKLQEDRNRDTVWAFKEAET